MRKFIVQQWVTVDSIAAEGDGGMSFVAAQPFAVSTDEDFKASAMEGQCEVLAKNRSKIGQKLMLVMIGNSFGDGLICSSTVVPALHFSKRRLLSRQDLFVSSLQLSWSALYI